MNLMVKKNYENWSTFAKVISQIKVAHFFETSCSHVNRNTADLATQLTETQPTDLATQLEVGHDDSDLRTRDDNDDEDDEQESKQIVVLVLPD